MYLFYPGRERGSAWQRFAGFAVLCYPFFLWNTFTSKHYSFVNALSLIGIDQWRIADRDESPTARTLATICLIAAAASSQLTLPIGGALCANVCWQWWSTRQSGRGFPWWKLAAASSPLLVMGTFIAIWGGAQPHLWATQPNSNIATYRFDVRQVMIGLILLGVWVAPLSRN